MKATIISILFLVPFYNNFYEKVLGDYKRKSCFIAFEISCPQYTGKVVIENDDLYHYFSKSNGFSKERYMSFMKEQLSNKTTIKLDSLDLLRWHFFTTEDFICNNKFNSLSLDSFVAKYFRGNVLKDDVGYIDRNIIIYKLFEWNIPSKIDDETGFLILGNRLISQ